MIKKISTTLLVLCLVVLNSCKLDLLDNPNAVTTSNTDINYLLNQIELSYAGHFNSLSDPGMRLTRMLNQGSAIYDNAVSPGNFDGAWTTAYAAILTDVKTIIPLAEKAELFVHAGIARTLRASVLINLVDAFGDVPYTEAIDPTNFNPGVDAGATIYKSALTELDEAIKNFAATSKAGATNDLLYAGNADSWTRVANTLKLKIYLNMRLTDAAGSTTAINALIAGGKLISTATQNFAFKFGSNLTNPDTRHPRYGGQYSSTGGGDYQSNSYMGTLYSSKGFPDPRIRYYFYRQTIKNPTDVNALRCVNNSKPAHYSDSDVFLSAVDGGLLGPRSPEQRGYSARWIAADGLGRLSGRWFLRQRRGCPGFAGSRWGRSGHSSHPDAVFCGLHAGRVGADLRHNRRGERPAEIGD